MLIHMLSILKGSELLVGFMDSTQSFSSAYLLDFRLDSDVVRSNLSPTQLQI
uniref:Uncharacterized protein n=1 Tax=Nelumbo nucifera TaxID=4432 RepID=A0A822ZSW2_NELNU|nr:TPA_asm: hypothetical protein HUJ06_017904 [Nelumbo nucifera]